MLEVQLVESIIVRGGQRLVGSVEIEGAKKRGITYISSKYFSRRPSEYSEKCSFIIRYLYH